MSDLRNFVWVVSNVLDTCDCGSVYAQAYPANSGDTAERDSEIHDAVNCIDDAVNLRLQFIVTELLINEGLNLTAVMELVILKQCRFWV